MGKLKKAVLLLLVLGMAAMIACSGKETGEQKGVTPEPSVTEAVMPTTEPVKTEAPTAKPTAIAKPTATSVPEKKITEMEGFKGYIHDVGGPTANFRAPSCKKQLKSGTCRDRQCLYPSVCPNAEVDHSDYVELLRKLRALPRVKKVFIRSGIRYDYLISDKDDTFFHELCEHHVSGQLKVAPEHCSATVLDRMGKPHIESYKRFADEFYKITKKHR